MAKEFDLKILQIRTEGTLAEARVVGIWCGKNLLDVANDVGDFAKGELWVNVLLAVKLNNHVAWSCPVWIHFPVSWVR